MSQETAREGTAPRRGRFWTWLLLIGGFLLSCLLCFVWIVPLSLVSGAAGRSGVYAEPVAGPAFAPQVAVVMLQGTISSQGTSGIVAQRVEPLLRRLNRDASVRAVVLHINSPGGGVAASERIYHALTQMDKPLVAYFDELAASGGYYIAMAADTIVANPAALTGSIGVIAVFPHGEALMDKVGIRVTVIKSGPAKDMGSFLREMTPEERAYMQEIVDEMYDRFVDVVAQGRGISKEEVRKVADGRIYTAQKAKALGLIDELGFEEDAVRLAARQAGLTTYRVVRYYPQRTWLQQLLEGRTGLALFSESPWPLGLRPGVYYLWLP